VGPRARLDMVSKRKIHSPLWELNPNHPIVQPIANYVLTLDSCKDHFHIVICMPDSQKLSFALRLCDQKFAGVFQFRCTR